MDKLVEKEVNGWISSQGTVYKYEKEPLIMSKLPDGTWGKMKVDFFGPIPPGEYILVVADQYSSVWLNWK